MCIKSVSNYVLDVFICVCVCVNFIIPLLFSLSSSGLDWPQPPPSHYLHSFSRINKIILVININVLLSKLNTNPWSWDTELIKQESNDLDVMVKRTRKEYDVLL